MAYQYRSASAMDISLERPLPAHLQAPPPPSGTPQPISCTILAQLKLGESIPGVLPGTSSPYLELRAADAAADNIRGLLEELPASLAFQAGPFDAREESDDHAIPTLRLNRDAGGPFLHMVAQHAVLCQYYPFARKSPQHVPQAALLQIVTAGTEIVRAVSALISSQRTDVPLGYVLARIIFQAAVAAAHVVLRDPVGLLAGPARAVLERVTSILAARAGSQGSAPQLPVWNHRSFAVRVLRLLVPHPYTAPPPPGISRKRKRGQSDAVNMLHSPTDATFTFASAAGSPQAEDEDLELEGFEIPFIGPRISIQRQEESVDDTLKALQLQHTGATVPCIAAARPLEAQHTGASRNSQSEGQGRKHREREKETKGKEGGKKRPQIGIRDRTRPVTIAPAVAPAAAAAVPSPTPTPTPAEAGATHSISSTPSTMSNGSGLGAGHGIIKTEHEGDIVLGSRQAQRRRHDSNHSTTSTHPQEHHVHKFTVPMPPMMMDGIVSAHSYSNGHHSHHYQQIPTPISQPPAPLQPPASLQTELPPLAPLAPESYSLSESEHHGRPPYDQRRRSSLPALEPVQTAYHAQQFGIATYGSAMYSGYPQSFEDPMFMYSAGAHEIQPAQPFAHQPSDSAQQVQIPMTYTPPIQYHPGTSEQTQPIASPTQYHPHQREDGRDRDTRMHGAHGQSPQRPPTAVRISSSPGTMSPSEVQQLQHYSRRPSLQHGGSTFLAHAAGQPTVYGDITGPGHSQEVMSTHPFPVTINTAQLHGLEALSDTMGVEFTTHGTFRKRSDTFERERSASSSEGLALEPPAAWPTPADDSHTRWVTDPH
ncbi:hypothetical protein BKA62DRAFT_318416 [Auriculariales sp. MPI-PUGE-AT-0066]|nr:hypothetical protein BKA62DRAFT_318416 [Auriculariales sp. MPI-PUGE-AT-0066]